MIILGAVICMKQTNQFINCLSQTARRHLAVYCKQTSVIQNRKKRKKPETSSISCSVKAQIKTMYRPLTDCWRDQPTRGCLPVCLMSMMCIIDHDKLCYIIRYPGTGLHRRDNITRCCSPAASWADAHQLLFERD